MLKFISATIKTKLIVIINAVARKTIVNPITAVIKKINGTTKVSRKTIIIIIRLMVGDLTLILYVTRALLPLTPRVSHSLKTVVSIISRKLNVTASLSFLIPVLYTITIINLAISKPTIIRRRTELYECYTLTNTVFLKSRLITTPTR